MSVAKSDTPTPGCAIAVLREPRRAAPSPRGHARAENQPETLWSQEHHPGIPTARNGQRCEHQGRTAGGLSG